MRVPKKIVFLKAKFFSKTWLGKFTGDHCVDVSVAETTINKCEKQQKSKSLISSDCLRSIFKFLHLEKGTRASRWLGVKNMPASAGDMGLIPVWEDPLEKEMATHSSILTCCKHWLFWGQESSRASVPCSILGWTEVWVQLPGSQPATSLHHLYPLLLAASEARICVLP